MKYILGGIVIGIYAVLMLSLILFHNNNCEIKDAPYSNGQILYPDYIHQDTLVVVNAKFLNYMMANYNIGTDSEINNLLTGTTIKYSNHK